MQGRTTIFISHRVSTVRNADQIAVLHGGRLVETGTHDELLSRNGYYADLYNKQLLEEELAEV
jgi:ATP-binding cassette subfamily B protein